METPSRWEGSKNEPMLAHLLVGIAWEAFGAMVDFEDPSGKLESPASFSGGYVGKVKLIRPPGSQMTGRMGMGSKWNPARGSYFVRSYLYCSAEGLFRTLAEIEIPKATVGEGLGPVEEVIEKFVQTTRGRLEKRLEET